MTHAAAFPLETERLLIRLERFAEGEFFSSSYGEGGGLIG